MASVSLHNLGLDRLSIEERIQVAEAIWDSVVRDVEASPLPEWQRAELERREVRVAVHTPALAEILSVRTVQADGRGAASAKKRWTERRSRARFGHTDSDPRTVLSPS